MCRKVFFFVSLCGHIANIMAQNTKCEPSLCNYEGECLLENDKPTCKCVSEDFYSGDHCETKKEFCETNPCKNSGTCQSYLGHYNCLCTDEYSGQNCDVQLKSFRNLHFHYNRLAELGKEIRFLLTVQFTGTIRFSVKLTCDEILIDTFIYESKDPKLASRFRKSHNLKAVARKHGLRHSNKMPYRSGYHHVSYERFWTPGSKDIKLTITAEPSGEELYKMEVAVVVMETKKCSPVIETPDCLSVDPLLKINFATYIIIEAIVRKRCEVNSTITYKWSLMNFAGSIFLHSFDPTTRHIIKIPPYMPIFQSYRDEYPGKYTMYASVTEVSGRQKFYGDIRCYLSTISKNISAYILGGRTRQAELTYSITLDGSRSRDYNYRPWMPQNLYYRWDCSSSDTQNKYCTKLMGSKPTLFIPPAKLTLGVTYNYTLFVSSQVDKTNPGNMFYQEITAVDNNPLDVNIKCLRKCDGDKYEVLDTIEFSAECFNCGLHTNMTYEWNVPEYSVTDDKKLFQFETTMERNDITVELTINLGSRNGTAKRTLQTNENPLPGCADKSNPKTKTGSFSGAEYDEIHSYECSPEIHDNGTVLYEVLDAETDFVVLSVYTTTLKFRLPDSKKLTINAYDQTEDFSDNILTGSVTPMEVPKTVDELRAFLRNGTDEHKLHYLIKDGDLRSAMVLIYILATHITDIEYAKCIYDEMINLQLSTVHHVQQLGVIVKKICDKLEPLNIEKVEVIGLFLRKLEDGFRYIVSDGEGHELIYKTFERLVNSLNSVLEKISVKLEDLPMVQDLEEIFEDGKPLMERYIEFDEFDSTVLPRVNIMLTASRSLYNCYNLLSLMSHKNVAPGSTKGQIDIHQANTIRRPQEFSLEKYDGDVHVKLSEKCVTELKSLLKGVYLLVRMVYIKDKNLFWWFPNEDPINSPSLMLIASVENTRVRPAIRLKNPYEFSIKLDEDTIKPPTDLAGNIATHLDIAMFQIKVPESTTLVIVFTDATQNLRLMLQWDKRPPGYRVRDSDHRVIAETTQTFYYSNMATEVRQGYLAVMSAESTHADGGTNFSLNFMLRQCVAWNFNLPDPAWSPIGCIPLAEGTTESVLHCSCTHMSSFGARIFPATVMRVPGDLRLLEELPINWAMVAFYTTLFALMAMFLVIAIRNLFYRRYYNRLLIEISDKESLKDFNILLRIHTGGKLNAGTTANIHLSLQLRNKSYRRFRIYQDSAHHRLRTSSTCYLRLPLDYADLSTKPMRMRLKNDGAGRYPTWYCHSIAVRDMRSQKQSIFMLREWITTRTRTYISIVKDDSTKCGKFKRHLELIFVNWFGFQPLTGPWQCGNRQLNRSERALIWLTRFSITITAVTCYFGVTTLDNYEDERQEYGDLNIDVALLFALAAITYVVGLAVEFLLILLLLANKNIMSE